MTTHSTLTIQHRMITKAREVAREIGPNITPIEAALIALEAYTVPRPDGKVIPWTRSMSGAEALQRVKEAAATLDQEQCGFTIAELLQTTADPSLAPISRVIAGRVLRDSGYFRKQIRRDGERPLVWFCDYTYDLYNPQHP